MRSVMPSVCYLSLPHSLCSLALPPPLSLSPSPSPSSSPPFPHAVNLLAIVILSRGKCGLSTCTTRYLVAMAAADLLTIFTAVILGRIKSYYFRWSFLSITPVYSVIDVLSFTATHCSVWFTVAFTFDRFVAICCQKLKTKYCTGKTAAVVLTTIGALFYLENVPRYFTRQPGVFIDNVPWFCDLRDNVFTDPGWIGYDWVDTILVPFLPFAGILLLNALTVRHILVASRVRKGLKGQSKGENCSDPEMENRRRSVILLFTISGSFILLWMTTVVNFIYYQVSGEGFSFNDSEWIFIYVGVLLSDFSCCTNTFIYAVTQSKFREQIIRTVKYSVPSVLHFINKAAS
ncbi:probable G-protein coupled receptor 139 isoform X1 [Hypanus sabinus]|uniref:probable G-protein coupled receptor 139 isoform X1 n=1 Tax=Hypanus sabinus TaxID=79690 RepID=UPI0028C3F40A|nr:probable G-protein coupled receptor 139 isoform X1 [Hypanus sabinus]